MGIVLEPREGEMRIRVDGALTVMEAAEARDQLALGVATAQGPLHIDLSGLTDIDTAGLQLLLAVTRAAAGSVLDGASPELLARIERFGLRSLLPIREADHGS